MTTTELHPGHGITVTTFHGERDGIPVVQIDTTEHTGRLRVNLNDGPPLYDGDPELHSAPGPFVTAERAGTGSSSVAGEAAQRIADAVIVDSYVDAATFAFALETEPIDLHTVRALMAKTARAAIATLAPAVSEVRTCIDALNEASEGDSNDAEIEAAAELCNAAGWLADAADAALA